MENDSNWYHNPTHLLDELRHHELVFRRPLVISGYEDAFELRRGGQGVVYSAIQKSTKRRVAIKVLFEDDLALETKRRRFEREIELVANLRHPNVVKVHDSGITSDDRLYFVMEYIEGVPLNEYCQPEQLGRASAPIKDPNNKEFREGVKQDAPEGGRQASQLSVEGKLRLFAKICEAVNHAHQRGVIHRDLKPSNIRIDASGEPHVLDFGVAKTLETAVTGSGPTVTRTGYFLGTLAYASPEQVQDDSSLIDIRSDVYSLGVILYELLTGEPPYHTSGPMSEIIKSITEVEPQPPGKLLRRKVGKSFKNRRTEPKANDELDTIVLKALNKDPQQRYQSAESLRQDVLRYLAGQPIDAKRDSGWYMLKKNLWRYKLQAAAVVAFIFLLAGFGTAMAAMYQHAQTEADKYKHISLFLEDTLYSVEAPTSGRDVTVREVLDESIHFIESTLTGQPEVEASLRTTIGKSYRSLGLFEKSEQHLQRALEIRRELFGGQHMEVTRSLNSLAMLRHDQAELEEAERMFRESLDIRRSILGEEHFDVATQMSNLALLLCDKGEYEEAEQLLRQQTEICRKVLGDEDPSVAQGQYNLANLLQKKGDWEGAERLHRQCLELRRQILPEDHPGLGRSLVKLGKLLTLVGKPHEAEPLLRECRRSRSEVLPENHWRIAEVETSIAGCLIAQEHYEEAEELLLHSFEVFRTDRGETHPLTIESLQLLIKLYESWDKSQIAVEYQEMLPPNEVISRHSSPKL